MDILDRESAWEVGFYLLEDEERQISRPIMGKLGAYRDRTASSRIFWPPVKGSAYESEDEASSIDPNESDDGGGRLEIYQLMVGLLPVSFTSFRDPRQPGQQFPGTES